MQNTVAHLSTSALSENLQQTSLIVFLLHLYYFCKCGNRYRDILDDRDNFVVNIEI